MSDTNTTLSRAGVMAETSAIKKVLADADEFMDEQHKLERHIRTELRRG